MSTFENPHHGMKRNKAKKQISTDLLTEIFFLLPPEGMIFCARVFCDGAIHWYSKEDTSVYFAAYSECLKTMPMPPNLARLKVESFCESRGHLHLIVTKLSLFLHFDVWEMAPDYSGWSMSYRLNLNDMRIPFPDIVLKRFTISVLLVIRAQKEEESIVLVHVYDELFSCNAHDLRKSEPLCDLDPHEGSGVVIWSDTFQYFESLASV